MEKIKYIIVGRTCSGKSSIKEILLTKDGYNEENLLVKSPKELKELIDNLKTEEKCVIISLSASFEERCTRFLIREGQNQETYNKLTIRLINDDIEFNDFSKYCTLKQLEILNFDNNGVKEINEVANSIDKKIKKS